MLVFGVIVPATLQEIIHKQGSWNCYALWPSEPCSMNGALAFHCCEQVVQHFKGSNPLAFACWTSTEYLSLGGAFRLHLLRTSYIKPLSSYNLTADGYTLCQHLQGIEGVAILFLFDCLYIGIPPIAWNKGGTHKNCQRQGMFLYGCLGRIYYKYS